MMQNPTEKIALGRTNFFVSRLCFGLGPIGNMPETYGYSVEPERARETVRAVLDSPVNFLDRHELWLRAQRGADWRSDPRTWRASEGFVISSKLDRDMETNKLMGASPPLIGRKPEDLACRSHSTPAIA